MSGIETVVLIVMDSVGAGELPDAGQYGDEGSNTLANTAKAVGGLHLPNLQKLGLGNITNILGVPAKEEPLAAYGKMIETSPGKDTTTGHWEMAGIILDKPFPVFPEGFPPDFIAEFEKRIARNVLAYGPASGTEIIQRLGREHMDTGYPIVYTSADSVFQIAAHEQVIPVRVLYKICEIAREMLVGDLAVGRVIARPFIGVPGNFKRTYNRHDYSLKPTGETILDKLTQGGHQVYGIGKIHDIFAGVGISEAFHTDGNKDGVAKTLELIKQDKKGLIFTNLVDFDSSFGHRNDPQGYAVALEELDQSIPDLMESIDDKKLLIITADHGCDPTTASTDHSREHVPLLVYSPAIKHIKNLGTRTSFSDVAMTIAEIFGIEFSIGKSFAQEILGSD